MSKDVKFVTDADGNRTAVILPIDEYEQMLEDLHLIRVYNESREDERIPWEQVKDELIAPAGLRQSEERSRPLENSGWRLAHRLRDQRRSIRGDDYKDRPSERVLRLTSPERITCPILQQSVERSSRPFTSECLKRVPHKLLRVLLQEARLIPIQKYRFL